MLNPYFILIALVLVALFLFISPKYKILIALFVMSGCFDLMKRVTDGVIDLWDVGFILLFIAYLQLLVTSGRKPHEKPAYEKILIVFVVWTLIEFAWSLSMYPLLPTIKAARQIVLGYMTYFAFVSFFKAQNYELEPFFRLLYRLTFVFVIIFLLQPILHIPVLKSLSREYEGLTRYLPVFLSYSLLFAWVHITRYFSGEKLSFSDYVYLALMVLVILGTYTRSVYFGVMIILCMMLFILFKDGKLQLTKFMISTMIACLALTAAISSGKLDKVIDRTLNGLQLISGNAGKDSQGKKIKDDTYNGRVGIIQERFAMVLQENPLMGYGFVHDDIAYNQLRLRPRVGSVRADKNDYKYSSKFNLTIYSADVTWGNILINTGITGFTILLIFCILVILTPLRKNSTAGKMYYYQCAFYLQFVYIVINTIAASSLSADVQIPCLFLAGYTICLQKQKESSNNVQII